MNTLEQQPKSFILGSQKEIESLENAENARILVISDSHGSSSAIRKAVAENGKDCNALVFCGDGITDLIEIFENSMIDEELASSIPPVIAAVSGNSDWTKITFARNKTFIIPDIACFTAAKKRIFITHGHEYEVYCDTKELQRIAKGTNNARIICFGHTHRRFSEMSTTGNNDVFLLNPGSCSRPRDSLAPSCAVLEIKQENISAVFIPLA